VLNFKGKNNLGICSSCVHAKYQLSSFNIVEAIKEKGQKLGMINVDGTHGLYPNDLKYVKYHF